MTLRPGPAGRVSSMKAYLTGDSYPPLLRTQIQLIEASRDVGAALAEAGAENDKVLVDAIANDRIGASS